MIERIRFAAWLMLAGNMAVAHHSPVNFDLDVTDFSVSGTITSLSFRNPHSVIELEVPSPDGQMTQWYIEFSSVNLLLRRNWELDRIATGNTITCIGNPSRDGTREMYMWTIRLADGKEFGRCACARF